MSLDLRFRQSRTPWLDHYPDGVPPRLDYPDKPLGWLLEQAAESYPDRIACHYCRQQFTYVQLFEAACRTKNALLRRGLRPGDRVGVLLPNVPEFLIAVYGIWMAGGVVVTLSPLMVAEEIDALLNMTRCREVVALDVLVPLVHNGDANPDDVLVVTLKDRLPHWERLGYRLLRMKRVGIHSIGNSFPGTALADEIGAEEPTTETVERSISDPAYILPTGGTTGNPKAVVLTHRNLMANALQISHWAGSPTGSETILAMLPFFHSYGLSTCVTGGVAMSATLVLHHRFNPHTALSLIQRHRPTIFFAVPAMLSVLNERLRRKPADLSSIRICISGGAPLEEAVGKEFAEHSGSTVVEGYGLSEASPVTHVGPLDGTARSGTIGLPLPDTDARIVDPVLGRKVFADGEIGELVVRGPQVMAGYWHNAEETARAIRNGWLFTGDLATRDKEGFFRIVDRKKDLIITSGMNVYPADVEHVLRQYPDVADVAVIGVPDSQRGEIVKAVVTLCDGARFDEKEFEQFARQHLSSHKVPRDVEVLSGDLPRNFLGKVLRRQLRDTYMEFDGPAAEDLSAVE